ncbi:hypothetical protein J5N97_004613 [Dioscorea zingiberensis]|uniref:DNA helicase n=1 Tax=Dioscorea zingiberensis TaxID=325984 RepID=A0A9D5D869_9LILI|nr:hypothetical protein J5N97_004613 [Dioscorea zingiberensis]
MILISVILRLILDRADMDNDLEMCIFFYYKKSKHEEYISTAYSRIRQDEDKSSAPHSYTTIRKLLSILGISIALARLQFSETNVFHFSRHLKDQMTISF